MRVYIEYDLILNVHLCYIHHVSYSGIFVTQYKIVTKRLSEINTTSVWIKTNTSTHDMTGEGWMYGNQMV